MKKKTLVASLILALLFLGATSISSAETVTRYTGRHGMQHAIHTEYDHFCHNLKSHAQPKKEEQTTQVAPNVTQEATNQQAEVIHNTNINEIVSETPQVNSAVETWHDGNQQNTQEPVRGAHHGNPEQAGTNHQGGRGHRNRH